MPMSRARTRAVLICAALLAAAPVFAAAAAAPAKKDFKPNPKLTALAANTALDLGAFKVESPEGEGEGSANRVTDYSGMTYDPHNHRVLLFGGGHATTWTDTIYAFDFETLQWSSLYKPTPSKFYKLENHDRAFWKAGGEGPYPRPIGRHTYDLLIVPPDRAELLMLRSGTGPSGVAPGIGYIGGACGAYSFEKNAWEMFDPTPFGGYGGAAEYDPVSKKVIGSQGQGVFVFDPETRKSSKILDDISDKFKVSVYSGTMMYCPLDTHIYAIPAKMFVWRLELDRQDFKKSKIVKLEPSGEAPPERECAFVWDDTNKLFVGNIEGGKAHAYDPARNAWLTQAIQGVEATGTIFHCQAYDPVNNVHLFIGSDPKNKYGKKTFAYRWK